MNLKPVLSRSAPFLTTSLCFGRSQLWSSFDKRIWLFFYSILRKPIIEWIGVFLRGCSVTLALRICGSEGLLPFTVQQAAWRRPRAHLWSLPFGAVGMFTCTIPLLLLHSYKDREHREKNKYWEKIKAMYKIVKWVPYNRWVVEKHAITLNRSTFWWSLVVVLWAR